MRKWLWLVAFVLGFVGCDERDDPGLADSATSADAGSSVDDAGSLADARPLADADVTDGGDLESERPTASAVAPPAFGLDVPVDVRVIVQFSERMDAATITAATFRLQAGAAIVPAEVAYDEGNQRATLTPDTALDYGTNYLVTVAREVTDLAGNMMADVYQWSFTTANEPDTVPPEVVNALPAPGAVDVPSSAIVYATFSEDMDPASLDASSFTLTDGAEPLSGTIVYNVAARTVSFEPASDLPYGRTLTATVTTGATDFAGNPLSMDHAWQFTIEEDAVPPSVVAVDPREGDTLVPLDATVRVTFSEPIDSATADAVGLEGVTATTALLPDGVTVELTPDAPLSYDTTYRGFVADTITDLAGNAMGMAYEWTFTTMPDTVPPVVVSTTPIDGAVVGIHESIVFIELSEPIDASTVNSTNVRAFTDTHPNVLGSVVRSGPTTIRVALHHPLEYLETYTVELSTGITDLAGNGLASPFVLEFTAEADTVPPEIVAHAPGVDGRLVGPSQTLRVRFSEPMDVGTLSASTVSIDGVAGTVTYDDTTHEAEFTPSAPLIEGATYTARVTTGATDLSGNPLAAGKDWSFRVGSDAMIVSIAGDTADHASASLAFESDTKGYAAWSVYSGTGTRIVAAPYDGSGFGTETVIAEYPGDRGHATVQIAADGSGGYAIAWTRNRSTAGPALFASVFDGSWSPPAQIGTVGSTPTHLRLASDGRSFAVAWNQTFRYYAAVYDSGLWTVTNLGDTGSGSGVVTPIQLAANHTGYAMTWFDRVSVYDGTTWRTASIGGTRHRLAAGDDLFGVSSFVYATSYLDRNHVQARTVTSSGDVSAAQRLTSYTDVGFEHDIAPHGNGFAVVSTARSDLDLTGAYVLTVHDLTPSSATPVFSDMLVWSSGGHGKVEIETNGNGNAIVWGLGGVRHASVRTTGAFGAPVTLYASDVEESALSAAGSTYFLVQRGSDGRLSYRAYTSSWLADRLVTASSTEFRLARSSGRQFVGLRASNGLPYAARLESAAVTGERLDETVHRGSIRNVLAATNEDGVRMWLYESYSRGVWTLRGCTYDGTALGPQVTFATSGADASLTAHGSSFFVAWQDGDRILVRSYTPATDTLSGTSSFATTSNFAYSGGPAVASNGTSVLLAWAVGTTGVKGAFYDGSWGSEFDIDSGGTNRRAHVAVVSDGTGFLVTWQDSLALCARPHTGTTWQPRTTLGATNESISVQLYRSLAGAGSYAVVRPSTSTVYAHVYDGTHWVTPATLPNTSASLLSAATDGSEYRVFVGGKELVYDGSWSPATTQDISPVELASDGAGYAAVWIETDGGSSRIMTASYGGGEWSMGSPIRETTLGPFGEVHLGGTAGVYSPYWTQPAAQATEQALYARPEM